MGPQWIDGGELTVKRIVTTIFGGAGIGKTSLALTADKPALIDCDFGGAVRALFRAGKPILTATTWKDVRDGLTEEALKGRETLVIDTVGGLLEMITVHLIASNSSMSAGSGNLSPAGWGALKREFLAFLDRMKRMDLDIVLVAHSEEKEGTDGKPVERIYISGGSKVEVARQSHFMIRLKPEKKKIRAEFSPSEAASGKNPAMLEPRLLDAFAPGAETVLADLIAATKAGINDANRKQEESRERGMQVIAAIQKLPATAEAFNGMRDELRSAPNEVKQQLVAVGQSKGLTFADGTFSGPEPEAAAPPPDLF